MWGKISLSCAVVAIAANALIYNATLAQANSIAGVGLVKISGDKKSIPAIAENEAKKDLVKSLLKQSIGAERVNQVSDATLSSIANQILPEMIISKNVEKIGDTYKVTIIADINKSWFMQQMDNEGINTSIQQAGANNQLMFIMIEQKSGIGRDYAKPQQITTNITHNIGAEYTDKSKTSLYDSTKSSEKASSGSSLSANAYSAYGGGSVHGGSRSGYSSNYGSTTSYSDKTDIEARSHDNFTYNQTISYQKPPVGSNGKEFALSALSSNLINHGIDLAAPDLILSKFFNKSTISYSELKDSSRFSEFMTQLSSQSAPFFMGGTMEIFDSGRDEATNAFKCNGNLDVKAYDTISSKIVAGAVSSTTAVSSSAEDCEAQIGEKLAVLASNDLGPKIQSYWRKRSRITNETIQAAQNGGVYTVVLQGNDLSPGIQTDFLEALEHADGIESQNMLSLAATQMSFAVKYEGNTPIHLSIYKKLRSVDAFKNAQVKSEGRLITFCVSQCR